MKGIIFFAIVLTLIFPLYNVQRADVFAVEGVSSLYFVEENGEGCVISLQESKEFNQNEIKDVEGIIMLFDNVELLAVVEKLDAKIVKEENIEGLQILYGYTNLYSDFIYVDGKQSNVQLVQKQDQVIAGLPIILSGY